MTHFAPHPWRFRPVHSPEQDAPTGVCRGEVPASGRERKGDDAALMSVAGMAQAALLQVPEADAALPFTGRRQRLPSGLKARAATAPRACGWVSTIMTALASCVPRGPSYRRTGREGTSAGRRRTTPDGFSTTGTA